MQTTVLESGIQNKLSIYGELIFNKSAKLLNETRIVFIICGTGTTKYAYTEE